MRFSGIKRGRSPVSRIIIKKTTLGFLKLNCTGLYLYPCHLKGATLYSLSLKKMGSNKTKIYSTKVWTAMSMILVLLWLTVSLPFIYQIGILLTDTHQMSSSYDNSNADDTAERFMANNAEEKGSEDPNTFNEEYIHEYEACDASHMPILQSSILDRGEDCINDYHGELHVPPPNHC